MGRKRKDGKKDWGKKWEEEEEEEEERKWKKRIFERPGVREVFPLKEGAWMCLVGEGGVHWYLKRSGEEKEKWRTENKLEWGRTGRNSVGGVGQVSAFKGVGLALGRR